MALKHSIIGQLPKMTWRGLESPPYDSASISGSFSLAEHRYPYINGASHDNVGADPVPMKFRLHFLSNLGPDYFPKLFTEWFNAVAVDGTKGKLQHPVYGLTWAMVKDWSVDVSADRDSGAIMEVSFIETLPDPSVGSDMFIELDIAGMKAAAEAIDIDYSKLKLPWPDGVGETSLLDMVKKIDGMATQARATVEGYLNQSLGTIEAVMNSAESFGDNAKWALGGNLITLWNGVKDLGDKAGVKTRVTAKYAVKSDTNLDRVSEATGNTVGELIGLNESLLDSPKIKKGSVVTYYTDKEFNSFLDDASDSLGV